jgi:integrase/recombinase XerC
MQLSKAVKLFLEDQRETTRQSYKYPLRYLVAWMGEARLVETIKPEHLLEYHHESLRPRGYAPATERKHLKTIKTLFNWLVNLDLIVKSPARVLKVKRLPLYIERDKAMTDEELGLLLDYTRWKFRDHALILFLADTGGRIGGAAGLKVGELDLENHRARVTEKGDKTRPVHFGPLCAAAIARWLLVRPVKSGLYVFSTTAAPMKADNISLMIRRACARVGIRTLSGHSLRHRKGHQFADQKTPITLAATYLGHTDPMVTAHHYYPADWESARSEGAKLVATQDLRPRELPAIIDLNERRKAT